MGDLEVKQITTRREACQEIEKNGVLECRSNGAMEGGEVHGGCLTEMMNSLDFWFGRL